MLEEIKDYVMNKLGFLKSDCKLFKYYDLTFSNNSVRFSWFTKLNLPNKVKLKFEREVVGGYYHLDVSSVKSEDRNLRVYNLLSVHYGDVPGLPELDIEMDKWDESVGVEGYGVQEVLDELVIREFKLNGIHGASGDAFWSVGFMLQLFTTKNIRLAGLVSPEEINSRIKFLELYSEIWFKSIEHAIMLTESKHYENVLQKRKEVKAIKNNIKRMKGQ